MTGAGTAARRIISKNRLQSRLSPTGTYSLCKAKAVARSTLCNSAASVRVALHNHCAIAALKHHNHSEKDDDLPGDDVGALQDRLDARPRHLRA